MGSPLPSGIGERGPGVAYTRPNGGLDGDRNIANLTANPGLSVTLAVLSAMSNLSRKGLIA